jgi:signal peptidase I
MKLGRDSARAEVAVASVFDVWRKARRISRVIIATGSMEPCIRTGATVVVDHSVSDFLVGDIIVFRNHGHLTAHRIYAFRPTPDTVWFETRGDNTADRRELVDSRLVMGKVIQIYNGH